MNTQTERIHTLAETVVKNMNLDDLQTYAVEQLLQFYSDNPEQLKKEWLEVQRKGWIKLGSVSSPTSMGVKTMDDGTTYCYVDLENPLDAVPWEDGICLWCGHDSIVCEDDCTTHWCEECKTNFIIQGAD